MEDSTFRFLGYRVPEFSLEIKDSYLVNPNLKNDIAINIQKNFMKDNNRFVEVVLGIKVTNSEETLKINISIKGGFLGDEKMPDKLFEDLQNISAPSVLFPYARAIISSCTSQAGIPPIILPLMNFTNVARQNKDVVTEEIPQSGEPH